MTELINIRRQNAMKRKAILETIHVNFPDKIVQVQILINGREIESIAGHFNTSQPLNVQVADNTL